MTNNKLCEVCGEKFFKKATCSSGDWKKKSRYCSKVCWYRTLSTTMQGNNRGFKKGLTPWNKGKEWSQTHRAKLSAIHLNSKWKDDLHPRWKGDEVGYGALHDWVVKVLGKPTTCEFCKKTGLTGHKIQWANKSGWYKRDTLDWLRLCSSCHKKYDHQKPKKKNYIPRTT